MIHFVKHSQIDFSKWDNCLDQCFNKNLYAQSWYLNLVCGQWHALILNDYEAIMPLYERVKWSVFTIRQPVFCQQLGVFAKNKDIDLDMFLDSIPKKYRYINFNLNRYNKNHSFRYSKRVNHELYLSSGKVPIANKYSKSTLKNIKRAQKNGIKVSSSPDSSSQFNLQKKILGKKYMNKRFLLLQEKIILYALKNNKGKMFSVELNNENCCSIFLLIDNKRLILQSSYCNKIGKQNGAFFFLLDYIFNLEEYKDFVFDFEGSNIEGVAKRNLGFGAELTYYHSIIIRRFPFNLFNY